MVLCNKNDVETHSRWASCGGKGKPHWGSVFETTQKQFRRGELDWGLECWGQKTRREAKENKTE